MTVREIIQSVLAALGLAILPVFYQSCSGSTPQLVDRGIKGGSLTLLSATRIYDYNFGRVDSYIEQYDDKYNAHSINLMELPQPMLSLLDTIPDGREFVVLLLNGHLNSGIILKLNDKYYHTREYYQLSLNYTFGDKRALPVFRRSTLKDAKLIFDDDVIQKGRLLNSRLDCVASNRPGQKGEHRNGALTLQVMDSKNHSFDAFTRGAAQKTEIYIEYSVFALHRHGLCY